ncbi:MAG: chlorinating enzyme [Inquilinus sp.]|nr:chlorinating enzyme [Inquilinus sp.]
MGSYALSKADIEEFRQQGIIGPLDLYDRDEILRAYKEEVRPALFDRSRAPYDLPVDAPTANYDRHLDIGFLGDHVRNPRIVDKLTSILGPDILCWRSEFFPKYPGDAGTQWHQADTFAHASGRPQLIWPENAEFGGAITVWTAFTDCTISNGCMRFIPGTQTAMHYDEMKGMTFQGHDSESGFFGYDYRELQVDADWAPDESKAVSKEMRAGQFIIFWSTLMHASYSNTTSNQTRLAYATRYVPTSVRVYPDTDFVEEYGHRFSLQNYTTVLVAGADRFGCNKIAAHKPGGNPMSSPG